MTLPVNPSKLWENDHHSSSLSKKPLTHSGRASIILISKLKSVRQMETIGQCLCYKHSYRIVKNTSSHIQSHCKGIIHQSQVKLTFRLQRWCNIGKLMKLACYISKIKFKDFNQLSELMKRKAFAKIQYPAWFKRKRSQQRGREGKYLSRTRVLDEKPAVTPRLGKLRALKMRQGWPLPSFMSDMVLQVPARMGGQKMK